MRDVGERDNIATCAIDDGTVMLGNMPCVGTSVMSNKTKRVRSAA